MFFLLKDSLTNLPGIGPNLAKKLTKLGLFNIADLIYYFPRKWEDFGKIISINKAKAEEKITIKAKLITINQFLSPQKKIHITNAIFKDAGGNLKVTWFNQPYIINNLQKHKVYLLGGTVKNYRNQLTLTNPTIEPADKTPLHSGGIVPIYPLIEGITSKLLRKSLKYLTRTIKHIPETLSNQLINQYRLISLSKALENIHFPISHNILKQAKRRLSFEELIPIQLSIALNKQLQEKQIGQAIKIDNDFLPNFTNQLDFKLTKTQETAIKQIINDLKKARPMNRLLMGDVGSGKTIVAAAAIFVAVKNGFQTALMAPTEVLTHQHYSSLKPLLDKWNIKTTLLTGNLKLSSKQDIANNKIDVIIGTHALIQKTTQFKNLNLVIIDEQHRFGVGQRQALKNKNLDYVPHFLSLSATPIPRTLFLGLLQDLDISWLDSLPQGRLPIITKLIDTTKELSKIKSLINQEIKKKHKIFIIAPLIDSSTKTDTKTSISVEKHNIAQLFTSAKIATLHGRMKSEDKLKTMRQLTNGQIDILIATSIIEVGIDIPTASVIWIKNAESFGLAQLHQLRGRVGRSNIQSYCLIETNSYNPKTLERLEALINTNNGTKLAEMDLKLRGPGVFFKDQQSGFAKLKLTDLTNIKLIKESKQLAYDLLKSDPNLNTCPHFKNQIKLNYLTYTE